MAATADPEVAKRLIEANMQRCKTELQKADHYGRNGDIDAMRRCFERLKTVVKGAKLPPVALNEIKEQTLKVELDGLKKAIDVYLERAADCARVDDTGGRQNALKPVREYLSRALSLGAGDDFKVVTEKKIEIIMQTDSSKAVAKKGSPSNRLSAVKGGDLERAHQNERRRYKRFRAPALLITVEGKTYTVNTWSIGGGELPNWEGPEEGRYETSFKAEGSDMGFSDSIELVRLDGANAFFKFIDPTHSTLKLVQALGAQGKAPKE